MAFGRHQKPGRGFVFSGSNKGQPDYASDAEAANEIKRLLGTPVGGGGGGGNTPTLELTDGTHDITGVSKITTPVADLVVGGSSPNATLDLANTAVTPATYGDSTHVGQFVVDAKGRITGATSIAISFPASPVGANPTTQVDGSVHNGVATTFMRSDAAPKLADTAVSPATYGDSTHWATFTVDQQGRLTAASSVAAPAVPVGANPTATAGPAAVNGSASTFMRSDGAPAVQLGTAAQKGLVQVDGTTITASSGVISTPGGANPTATGSDVAVNGSAATFMRSDGAPAIQKTSASLFGLCKVDGSTVTASGGVISATSASGGPGFGFHPGYNSAGTRWYYSPGFVGGVRGIATGTVWFTPFYIPYPVTFTVAGTRPTAVTGTVKASLGLYSNVNGKPSAKLQDFGETVALAVNTVASLTGLSIALTSGWYWLAIGFSGSCTVPSVTAGGLAGWLTGTTTITALNSGFNQAWTYSAGNLPAVGSLGEETANAPTILLQL